MTSIVLTYRIPSAQVPLIVQINAELEASQYVKRVDDLTWLRELPDLAPVQALRLVKADFARCAARAGVLRFVLRLYASSHPISCEEVIVSPSQPARSS